MIPKVLQSHLLYRGPVFSLRQDQVRLPDGRLFKLDIVDHREAVTLIPFDENGVIWFVRQYRHPAGRELLELPAGVVELGESPEISAQREIREEIGMRAERLVRIGGFYLAPGYSTEYMHIFLATNLYKDPLPGDENEYISTEKIPLKQVMDMVQDGQIQDAKSLVALYWAHPYMAM